MIRSELKPAEYIAILKRRWVPVLVLTLIGGPVGYAIAHFLPPKYSSQTTVLIQQPTVPQTLVPPVVTGGIEQRLASMKAQILSRSRLEPVIRQFGLYPSEINTAPMEDLVARLQKSVDVSAIRPMEGTSGSLPGFNVTVTLSSPQKAQAVCTAITSMFIAENERTRQQHSEDTTQFLSQQLADAKSRLDDQNAKLAAFKTRYLGALPDDDKTNLNILTELTSQLNAATEALSRAQQDKSFMETSLNQALVAWQATQSGNNPLNLQQQLVQAQNHLADLQTRYTDSYPDVIRAKADITALKKQIADQEKNTASATPGKSSSAATLEPDNIQRLRAQIHTIDVVIKEKTGEQEELKRQIRLYEARVQSTPEVEQQYKALTLGYNAALDNYNELAKNRDQARMATDLEKRQEGETFAILDPANLPDAPSFPNKLLFAGGGFGAGLALGFALAFLQEMRDTSLRSEQDVEFALRLPVIAMIPAIGPLAAGKPVKFVPSLGNGQGIGETLNS